MTVTELIKGGIQAFNELTGKELQSALKAVQKSIYQRVSRLKGAELSSPAVRGLRESGGFISAKKASEAQMKSELQRGLQFLTNKTSTITGAREYRTRQIEDLNIPASTPDDVISAAWDEYHRLQQDFNAEVLEQIFGSKYRDAAHNIVSELAKGADPAEIRDMLQQQYEAFSRENNAQMERIMSGL